MIKTAINRPAIGIANIPDTIKRVTELEYIVKSQNGNGDYKVNSTDLGCICSCHDHTYRGSFVVFTGLFPALEIINFSLPLPEILTANVRVRCAVLLIRKFVVSLTKV